MDWSADGWRSAFRIELRVQAIGLASRGWPVLPGTYPEGSRWTGRSGNDAAHGQAVTGLEPVHLDWQQRLEQDRDTDQVASLWTERPYNLLVATGTAVEALEIDADWGKRAAGALRSVGAPTPIVATPDGRWYFLTAPGGRLCAELADSGRVRLHSTGSWIPLPPTTYQHGVVHWRAKPETCGWRLPVPEMVQDALCSGMDDFENVAGLVSAGR
ncbi:bifunctional DNA primase/polymerase [Parasphingorhabdus pacifica]